VHDFIDCSTDGCGPLAGVIQAKDGNFYGTTESGGTLGSGIIFKLTPGGVLTTLHTFDCGIEGCNPRAALIQAKDGTFYGTTPVGGVFEGGTIFKLGPNGGFTTLHALNCKTEGCNPPAALIQASGGYLYGTTAFGGAGGGGSVFKVTPNGALTTLQSFGCTSSDGCFPQGALVQAKDGSFYGTTSAGGASRGGTVFRLTPSGVLTTLHAFDCPTDGCSPGTALIQASDGNLYGTTPSGGTFGGGTAFKLTPGGAFTTLHAFECFADGCRPQAALIQASDGYLYGTTSSSGPSGFGGGTVFRLTLDGVFETLHAFDCRTVGCGPFGAVIQASDGNLYGTTAYTDGSGDGGTVFRLTLDGVLTTLHVFDCISDDGCGLFSTLIQASDGNLYGTTAYYGPPGSFGTVFKVTLAGDFATFRAFDGLDGEACSPSALMQARDGNLYGTFLQCGGGVFKLSLGGDFTTLVDCAVVCPSPGNALIQASDGYFYGPSGFAARESGGSVSRLVELVPNTLTALSPARVWIGLKNSDDVGARLDLHAEVRQNSTLIGSGEVLSVAGGSSGFSNAKLHSIPLTLSALDPMAFGDADIFSITVYVRNACTGSGKNSFTARLWFNDVAANSRFEATIAEDNRDYLLRSGFTLSTTAGTSRQSVDASSGGKCGPFVPFGTWRIVP
jgi:uncharacterized repeat protein (TIGR03803 family)